MLLKRRWREEIPDTIGANANNSTTSALFDWLYVWKWFTDMTCDNAFLILVCRARLLRRRIIVMRDPEVSSYARARPDLGAPLSPSMWIEIAPASDNFHPSKLIFVMRAYIALLKKGLEIGWYEHALYVPVDETTCVTKCTRASDIRVVN